MPTALREDMMMRMKQICLLVLPLLLLGAGSALADTLLGRDAILGRGGWLLNRADIENRALTGLAFDQSGVGDEFGGGVYELESDDEFGGGASAGLTMLASAVLPGAGEALMGHKRGYLMMAADIFSWTQVSKHHNDGVDKRDEYYDYADAHYSDEWLVEAYRPGSEDVERGGEGAIYFPEIGAVNDVSELEDQLPLYVTVEADRREYYENLGKWDQFIFGWDDYTRASVAHPEYDYEPTEDRAYDLQQPWVSEHREIYRRMRIESNDSFKSRDRWMYVNIGLRVFSVLQVAYLQGLLGSDDGNQMQVAGHPVQFIAQPQGLTRGVVATKVGF